MKIRASQLVNTYDIRGNLIPDAALAALALEHGVALALSDTDFARFRKLRWENPLRRFTSSAELATSAPISPQVRGPLTQVRDSGMGATPGTLLPDASNLTMWLIS